MDRNVFVDFDAFGVRFDAEVSGRLAQGKPRLRKADANNRSKLHLPQLVMAIAGLPEPARSDNQQAVQFPLENKSFVMDQMDFDVVEDDGISVVLDPLRVSILRSDFQVQLGDRLRAIAADFANIDRIRERSPELADAVAAHVAEVMKGINSSELRKTADRMIALKSVLFGQTNAGSALILVEAEAQPPVEAEQIVGKEGRLLMRLHVYKERDRKFAKQVKDHYRHAHGGTLHCEACGCIPVQTYGPAGESSMEAHHKVPIEQLQPDSVTLVQDMAMLCASCHRVVHSQKPCLTVEQVKDLIAAIRLSGQP
jgi:5-methylcytosine-specific restriction endonuclease McrA